MQQQQQDARVIAQAPAPHASLLVLAQRQEIMWRNGSTVQLHQVGRAAMQAPETFLRAMQREGLRWLVFDLRKVLGSHGGEIEADLLRLLPRDTPGVVFYTLRQHFAHGSAFTTAADACACATWWHADTTPLHEAA